jgi:hypothetical protein
MAWNSRVKIKHLLTDEGTDEAIRRDMASVGNELASSAAFGSFDRRTIARMKALPDGLEPDELLAVANRLLDRMYDFADYNRIWID